MTKITIIFIIAGFLIPSSSFIQATAQNEKEIYLFAAQAPIKTPENIEEAKELGEKALEVGERELPGIIGRIWKEDVLPLWQKMWDWFKTNIWPKIESWIKPEVEKRKPLIKKEFEKEKEEVKEELPKVGKSLWEKFKELLK